MTSPADMARIVAENRQALFDLIAPRSYDAYIAADAIIEAGWTPPGTDRATPWDRTGAYWDALDERDEARATVARARALCDNWEQSGATYVPLSIVAARLRATLDPPTDGES